jgi:hypothetical protein
VSSRARLDEYGARSRMIVADEFAWPVIADRHVAMYGALLAARGRSKGSA